MECSLAVYNSLYCVVDALKLAEAEKRHQEYLSCLRVHSQNIICNDELPNKPVPNENDNLPSGLSTLSGEIAAARQQIQNSLKGCSIQLTGDSLNSFTSANMMLSHMKECLENVTAEIQVLTERISRIEAVAFSNLKPSGDAPIVSEQDQIYDEVDLFGSDEEENEEAKKIREDRLAQYAAKKSTKPALVAKSNVILDVKPWDDETDMKALEESVRTIKMDGLLWGASKLVPLAYGIKKLQISSVIEDEKVSVDELQEKMEAFEDLVQSVDIAAFNKI